MPKGFFSSKIFKLAAVLAVLGLLIFFNPRPVTRPFKTALNYLIAPFQKIIYLSSLKIISGKNFLLSIGSIKKENEKLLQENQRLMAENARLADTGRRIEALEEQLNLLPREKYELESAYVIGVDPGGFRSWVEISKGKNHGVEAEMPVIVSKNILIGKVESVEPETSRVLLVTSPASKINALSAETGAKGLVSGKFGLGIVMERVLQTDEIGEGNSIVTSGLSNNVPRGIYIGRLQGVSLSEDKLFYQGVVSSPVDFSKLEIVSVIKRAK